MEGKRFDCCGLCAGGVCLQLPAAFCSFVYGVAEDGAAVCWCRGGTVSVSRWVLGLEGEGGGVEVRWREQEHSGREVMREGGK